eukprot:6190281-Pleurochrysis_carterae.AAC.1
MGRRHEQGGYCVWKRNAKLRGEECKAEGQRTKKDNELRQTESDSVQVGRERGSERASERASGRGMEQVESELKSEKDNEIERERGCKRASERARNGA